MKPLPTDAKYFPKDTFNHATTPLLETTPFGIQSDKENDCETLEEEAEKHKVNHNLQKPDSPTDILVQVLGRTLEKKLRPSQPVPPVTTFSNGLLLPRSPLSSSSWSPSSSEDSDLIPSPPAGAAGNKRKSFIRQYGGMVITLAGSILFSLVILLAKILQDFDFRPSGLSFWRYAGSMIPTIPMLGFYLVGDCRREKRAERMAGISEAGNEDHEGGKKSVDDESVFATVWPLSDPGKLTTAGGLLLRGILGNAAQILRFFALEYLSLGDTSVISNSSPVLVTIMAHFLLGERTGFVPILVAIVALSGVFIIIRPPFLTGQQAFDVNTLIGASFAAGSLLCSALVTILMRKVRRVHLALMVLVFAVVGMVQAFLLTQILGEFRLPQGLYDVLMVGGVVCCSFLGQICTIMGLKLEQAGVVSLIRTADVVFGFLFQFIFLGVSPDIFSSIGGSIVFFGILMIAFRKYVTNLPDQSRRRKFWRFLLY